MTWTRRQFLSGVLASGAALALPERAARAFGSQTDFDIPLLRYESSGWNPRPTAIRRILLEIEQRTSILISPDNSVVEARAEDLFRTPMLMIGGDRGFAPWRPEAREALRLFLQAGGFLVIDSAEGRAEGEFEESIRREMSHVLPGQSFTPLSPEHVLFKTFYLIDGAPGRLALRNHVDAITFDGRAAVLFSANDMMGAWARDRFGNPEFSVFPGGERQREMALRMGVNLAMYALTLDYKDDQVHIPFILRRRRWRTR